MSASTSLTRRQMLRRLGLGAGAGLLLPGCNGGRGFAPQRSISPFQPRGLHVSLPGDAHSSRAVTWFTDGVEAPQSVVEYDVVTPGMSAQEIQTAPLRHQVEAESEPTTGIDAYTHRARFEIDPELPLRYRVGSAAGFSPVKVVQTTPSDTWRFVHFGDQGVNHRAEQLTQALSQEDYDLLLIAGDLSYANGDQPIWDDWFELMSPIMSERVTMTAPGNHEQKDFGGDAFKNRFTHPGTLTSDLFGAEPPNSFYSFDYNRVHFLVTTAGALIGDGTLPVELANIELDLANAALRRAAGQIDFIVVMQHFTIWTDQEGRSPANPTLVALEENIFLRYGVDVALVGHDHVYQRSVPMMLGLPNLLGYVQMMVGTGGASIRLFDDNGPQSWSAKEFVGIGYASYEVDGDTIRGVFKGAPPLDMSEEGRQFAEEGFRVIDEFEIKARGRILAQRFVHKPRPAEVLLADFDAIERHTLERNAHALKHCG
ncbi:ser/Thr protein phosphatase family protein [Oceanococcus atlanticus]|uniref:Ser/Thr protein phosphatase family protein n=1 Tax=Oceanococcus atlanticus TaxID=1317117 RepID=A0A1Y1SGZ4_9GAMM|nr:metallophosphoesterase [Oceanococcus atlanticus]ORE88935.1 ser/Thr protein phosphatase family protein [Oceanococcus atlanticus]